MKPADFITINDHTIHLPSLGRDAVILDLGCNRGAFSAGLRRICAGRFYLIEANPELRGQLESEGWQGVFPCAVSHEAGTLQFNRALNDEGSSLLPLAPDSPYGCTFRDSVEVPARTLQSLVSEIGASRIDLVKMDVEGAEVTILEQLAVSELAAIGQFSVEFHCEPIFRFGLTERVEAVIRRLEGAGFLCLDFSSEVGWVRRDVLFLNRQWHDISGLAAASLKASLSLRVALRRLWKRIRFTLRPVRRYVSSLHEARHRPAADIRP